MVPEEWLQCLQEFLEYLLTERGYTERIFRKMGYITPSKSKKEILRSKIPNVKADRPNQVWEADLTYIHCGIDGWGYLFNVFDIFTREWVGYYCFDLSAVKKRMR